MNDKRNPFAHRDPENKPWCFDQIYSPSCSFVMKSPYAAIGFRIYDLRKIDGCLYILRNYSAWFPVNYCLAGRKRESVFLTIFFCS